VASSSLQHPRAVVVNDLDVVVVAFRSRDAIGDVVRSARQLTSVASVVVVDNGTDGSAEVARAAGANVVDRPDNPGFGASQNAGVALGAAPFALLLNPDAVPVANGIEAGLDLLRQRTEVVAVQGEIVNSVTGEPERSHGVELGPVHLLGRAFGARRLRRLPWLTRVAAHTRLRDHVERSVCGPVDVETLAATALLVRRSAFQQINGFDESYFLYGEDLDLCRRLRASGGRLVAIPEVFAVHDSGGSSSGWWERELHWWQGTMQFAARWWSTPRWIAALGAAVVRFVGLSLARPCGTSQAWEAVVARGLERRAQPGGRRHLRG